MKKRIYILLPLLLIMLIMGVDRVGAEEWDPNGGTTNTDGNFGGCSGISCFNDDEKMYGMRVSMVDSNGNVAANTKAINFWSDFALDISSKYKTFTVDNKKIDIYYFSFSNNTRGQNIENYVIPGLIPKSWYNSFLPNPVFAYEDVLKDLSGQTNKGYGNVDLLKIMISLLFRTSTDVNEINWNDYNQYYVKFEPLMIESFWGTMYYGNRYTIQGTVREVFDEINKIYNDKSLCNQGGTPPAGFHEVWNPYLNALFLQEDVFGKNNVDGITFAPASDCPLYLYYDRNDVVKNWAENYYFNSFIDCNGMRGDAFYGKYGYALGVITLKDKIKDTEPRMNQLKINKYEGIPSDNNNRFNGSAKFRIDKCTDDTSCEVDDENHWENIINREKADWSKELTITSTDLTEGTEYRIKEMGSNPSAEQVYYKFGDELQQIKDGDGWFKFTYSKDNNVINVYNVSSGIQKECKDEVYNITNNNGLNLAQKHYFLYKLFEDTYTDNNNLVAFDVFKDEIKTGFESADEADKMCMSSDEKFTPDLSCSGKFELGTRIKNNLYPNENNLKHIILNADSLKLYINYSELYCATSYTMSNDFKKEKVKAGDLLWKEAPGHLTEKITCYGFVKDNNFKLNEENEENEEDLKNSLIDKLNNVDYDELPSISMKITTPTDSASNSITESEELKLEIIGNRQEPKFELFESTDFSVDGQRYQEIWFTALISNGDMKYDQLCYTVDGETDGSCEYSFDDVLDNGNPGFAISFEEEFMKGQKEKNGKGTLELLYNDKTYEKECDYSITPGPITTHEENSYEYNFEVRTIDTNNPFPGINGKDGEGRTVGSNWCTYDYIGKDIDGIKVGDINGDGKIVNSDVLKLNMILNSDSEEVKYADFNGDGITNNDDSIILQKYVGKLEKDFNCKNQGYLIQKYIKDRPNSNSTEAPMYTFTLKSNDIKKIREYNKDHNYNSFVPDKNNKLLSQFITDALNGTLTTNSLDYGREYTCKDNRGNEGC